MRDLEVYLTRRDIWHMLSEAGERESGIKNSVILFILLILTVISVAYTYCRMISILPGIWIFKQFCDYFVIAAGGIGGFVLVITYFNKIIQWFKLIRSPLIEGYHVRFGESQIEQWFDNGMREVYPYSFLLRIQKTKHILFLHVNRKENTSALLMLPSSTFVDNRE